MVVQQPDEGLPDGSGGAKNSDAKLWDAHGEIAFVM
jgi:hypothetical protein